jgi:hypothetical protein
VGSHKMGSFAIFERTERGYLLSRKTLAEYTGRYLLKAGVALHLNRGLEAYSLAHIRGNTVLKS